MPAATATRVREPDSEPRARRSGRNLFTATVVGVGLFAVTLAAAWYRPSVFAAILYILCAAAILEFRRALRRTRREVPLIPVLAGTAGMGVSTWYLGAEGLVVALLVACAGVVAWRVVDERLEHTMDDAFASIFTLAWIPFLASFLLLIAVAEDGWIRIAIFAIAVAGNDTGALFTGMALGKHKLAPGISPNKTWEGAIGGLVISVAAGAGMSYVLFDGQWHIGALVAAAVAVAAVIGDLAESVLKRDMNIKDMSGAMPGHGGVLDRLDSVLVAAPAAYVVFAQLLGSM